MNRRQFLAGLLASTATPALPDLSFTKPQMTLADYERLILKPLIDKMEHIMIYGNPDYQPVSFTGFIPDWVGTKETPDIKWRKICGGEDL